MTNREVNLEDIMRGKRNEKTEKCLEEIKRRKEARSRRPEGTESEKTTKSGQRQYAVLSYGKQEKN